MSYRVNVNKDPIIRYIWIVKNEDGQDLKMDIATDKGKEVARANALSYTDMYMQGNKIMQKYIIDNEPIIKANH